MRISDWSSDVCSSDLVAELCGIKPAIAGPWKHLQTLTGGVDDIAVIVSAKCAGARIDDRTVVGQREIAFAGHRPVERVAGRVDIALRHLLRVAPGAHADRSEQRRAGKEGVSTCRYRGWL